MPRPQGDRVTLPDELEAAIQKISDAWDAGDDALRAATTEAAAMMRSYYEKEGKR
jgi:hypothetical protein